jgi:hypothetical protein
MDMDILSIIRRRVAEYIILARFAHSADIVFFPAKFIAEYQFARLIAQWCLGANRTPARHDQFHFLWKDCVHNVSVHSDFPLFSVSDVPTLNRKRRRCNTKYIAAAIIPAGLSSQ